MAKGMLKSPVVGGTHWSGVVSSSVLRWFPHCWASPYRTWRKWYPNCFKITSAGLRKKSHKHIWISWTKTMTMADYGKSATPLETIFLANHPHGKITIPGGFSEHRSSNGGMRKIRLSPWQLEPQPHPPGAPTPLVESMGLGLITNLRILGLRVPPRVQTTVPDSENNWSHHPINNWPMGYPGPKYLWNSFSNGFHHGETPWLGHGFFSSSAPPGAKVLGATGFTDWPFTRRLTFRVCASHGGRGQTRHSTNSHPKFQMLQNKHNFGGVHPNFEIRNIPFISHWYPLNPIILYHSSIKSYPRSPFAPA